MKFSFFFNLLTRGRLVISGRFLVLIWSLSCLLLNMAYNCNIRAILMSPSFEKPIETVEDLIERGTNIYVVGVDTGGLNSVEFNFPASC